MASNYSKINKAQKEARAKQNKSQEDSSYGRGRRIMAKVIVIALGVLMVVTFSATSIMMALGQ